MMAKDSKLVVKIRSLSFSYDKSNPLFKTKKNILENINMSFPESSIYGLLGPSGCGKTTLLKLILGLKSPNSGTIEVNGRKPNDPKNNIPGFGVGFQPQETALYEEFTIRETMVYFAQIYGMKSDAFEKRLKFLNEFLQLPDSNRSVHNLSGGQQRRLSLAVAILHSPPFLILDEPTVGVDPLLREKIWTYLVDMSKEQKTSILITTHYVEEARRADVVALMRNGCLLVEQTPQNLMNYYSVDNIESVFLKVCMAQEDKSGNLSMVQSLVFKEIADKRAQRSSSLSRQQLSLSPHPCKRLRALTKKDVIRLKRNISMLVFQILSPTFSILMFLLYLGVLPTHLKIAIYNAEKDSKNDTSGLNCVNLNLGQIFLDQLNAKYITQEHFTNNESAQESVNLGKTFGALVVDKNFSINICRKALKDRYFNETMGSIKFYGDFSDYTISSQIVKHLWEAHDLFVTKAFQIYQESVERERNVSINPEAISMLLKLGEPPYYGDKDITFKEFMAPGMVIAVVFILSLGLTALSFVAEKTGGVLDRSILAGVKVYEILITQLFVQIFVLIFQIILLLVLLFWAFDIVMKGSYFLTILIILLQGVMGMTYGIFISVIAPDGHSALMGAFGSYFPILFMSGLFWPIHGMGLLKSFSYFLPQTTAVIALRNIMLKAWGLDRMWVFLGFFSTTVYIIFFLIISLVLSSETFDQIIRYIF